MPSDSGSAIDGKMHGTDRVWRHDGSVGGPKTPAKRRTYTLTLDAPLSRITTVRPGNAASWIAVGELEASGW